MTGLKLRSDWDVQITAQVVNWTKLFAQSHQTLFAPRGWSLGTAHIGLVNQELANLASKHYYSLLSHDVHVS